MLNLLFACGRVAFVGILLGGAAWAQPSPPSDDGQWTMPAKNFESTRYSGLDQIKIENAKDLRVAWTFSTGVDKGQEAAPLVVGDWQLLERARRCFSRRKEIERRMGAGSHR